MTSPWISGGIISMAVALTLLPGSASAECAWVLWSGDSPWSAYKTQRECDGARNVLSLVIQKPSLRCLPDAPITESRSTCTWVLWKTATVVSRRKTFQSKQDCETARDVANRTGATIDDRRFYCAEFDTSTPDGQGRLFWLLGSTPAIQITQSSLGTFPTNEQCEKRRGADLMKREERGMTSCLPDTVDPRKSKGRAGGSN